jgi:nucleoside-diphosphate-sugar epimerase
VTGDALPPSIMAKIDQNAAEINSYTRGGTTSVTAADIAEAIRGAIEGLAEGVETYAATHPDVSLTLGEVAEMIRLNAQTYAVLRDQLGGSR